MAYKIVNAEQLEADLASVADSIRAKSGTSDKLAFPSGFKSAVDGISAGGSDTIPDASTAEFGRVRVDEPYQAPTGKYYYNGVLLPDIPADVLASYPYAWIRNDTTNGYYDLFLAEKNWHYNTSYDALDVGTGYYREWYRIEIATAADATEWTYYKKAGTVISVDDNRPVVWSNHDIPNGSATATDIYFEGSEAVPQTETKYNYSYGGYVADAENYAVGNEAINEIAHRMQKHYSTYDTFTGAEVRDFIERCGFYESGTASSTMVLDFESSASGSLT